MQHGSEGVEEDYSACRRLAAAYMRSHPGDFLPYIAAEGKECYITGYMIPVDVDEDFYVLSRYPFANCFFCGGAGPESVVDLRFPDKAERSYQTDDRLTFKGTLRLNSDDVYQMNYILEGAVEHTP